MENQKTPFFFFFPKPKMKSTVSVLILLTIKLRTISKTSWRTKTSVRNRSRPKLWGSLMPMMLQETWIFSCSKKDWIRKSKIIKRLGQIRLSIMLRRLRSRICSLTAWTTVKRTISSKRMPKLAWESQPQDSETPNNSLWLNSSNKMMTQILNIQALASIFL